MGYGDWSTSAFSDYSRSVGRSVTSSGTLSSTYSAQDLFKASRIQPELDPYEVIRECRDTAEHPNTIPVILALDVTGSMGDAAAEVAKKLNEVMTGLYERVRDVEFLIMGIGDLSFDKAPIQASQFESDIRIAEQLDKIYFEGKGGNNAYESYTAAWYFGVKHTKLDCWDRGKKGIIITMGDEPLNPYLPQMALNRVTGDNLQSDVETNQLYETAKEKFDIYHLAVDDEETSCGWYSRDIKKSFGKYLDEDHLRFVNLNNIANAIVSIVTEASGGKTTQTSENTTNTTNSFFGSMTEISW